MSGQLYLHIGDCKTGSTTIQTMLAKGACSTPGTRLLYPAPGMQGMLPRTLTTRKEIQSKRWTGIARRLAETDWDVAVISTELFEFSNPRAVARAVRDHIPDHAETVRVIAYVRPHASRLVSQFAENLKLGHETHDFQHFYDRMDRMKRLDYADRLDRWQAEFGDRLIVRPFVPDRLDGGDVRRDFLATILQGRPFELHPAIDSNESLSLPDLTLLRMLNQHFAARLEPGNPQQVAFGKQFGRILHANPSDRPPEKLRLPRDIYDQAAARFSEDAERMDQLWVGRPCFVPALQAAAQTTVDPAQDLRAESYFDAETLRLMRSWADLLLRQMTGEQADGFAKRLRP